MVRPGVRVLGGFSCPKPSFPPCSHAEHPAFKQTRDNAAHIDDIHYISHDLATTSKEVVISIQVPVPLLPLVSKPAPSFPFRRQAMPHAYISLSSKRATCYCLLAITNIRNYASKDGSGIHQVLAVGAVRVATTFASWPCSVLLLSIKWASGMGMACIRTQAW